MSLLDKKQWEQDYLESKCIDCPWCGHDRPDHSCGNCYSEMNQDSCWKWQGLCSEKCFKYIKNDLPKIREEKEMAGVKCTCDDPTCYKCIGTSCQDDNCLTHPLLSKMLSRKK